MKKSVKIIITFLLILSAFSVLGIVFMDHNMHQRCPFAVITDADCGSTEGILTTTLHHVEGFKSFTEILVISSISALLAFLSVVLLSIFQRLFANHTDTEQTTCINYSKSYTPILIPNPILRFIALHNKKDTHLHLLQVVA